MRAASFFFHLSLSLRVIYESVLCQCKNNAANFFMTQFTEDGQRDPAILYDDFVWNWGRSIVCLFFLQKRISIKSENEWKQVWLLGSPKTIEGSEWDSCFFLKYYREPLFFSRCGGQRPMAQWYRVQGQQRRRRRRKEYLMCIQSFAPHHSTTLETLLEWMSRLWSHQFLR